MSARSRRLLTSRSRSLALTQILNGTFETGDLTQFDGGSNQTGGTLTVTTNGSPGPVTGTSYLQVATPGVLAGGTCIVRTVKVVDWAQGTVWRTSFSVYFAAGFFADFSPATLQLFGWDTFPVANKQMRLMFDGGAAGVGRMVRVDSLGPTVSESVTSNFSVTAGVWTRLTVEQKLHLTDGWTKVYKDGLLVASGTGKTWNSDTVTRIRYGYADFTGITAARTLYMDDITLSARTP
jgi:hypothetical protein